MIVLAIDPSGNFTEGKGTTGWAAFTKDSLIFCGQIKAESECFTNQHEYYNRHIELIKTINPTIVVLEDFKLYANKANSQINSRFETPKLIGILELYCYNNNIPVFLQSANEVKERWSDNILVNKKLVEQKGNKFYACGSITSDHIRDAIRHGMHFITFKLEKVQNGTKINRTTKNK